ncbi:uroporphyrinogen-III C-methyltransferase [Methylomicrobium sp. Wu6]|uniref:uroporphyrinogen-III C-methyltransferase n=1 Tax=Methylomicrobium sp. Wu6 TaxID=3107928 RepID=UPI002DD642F8|nr:uroporphyrinogen-III C-methyltransferase [Methylomicrobium sp. Wu6]MEC4749345.1 uroporphyrinogen-III C-methyltransferase [Methylomicrobium sp. Wu6]
MIIILIIFAVAGAGYYFLMQLRDRQSNLGGEVKGEMAKKIADYQAQLTAIQEQLSTLESTMANKDDHFTKRLDEISKQHSEKLDSTRKDLTEEITRLQRQLGKTRGDWLIADAEYLLGAANERLQLVGDVNTAREALEAADQRLRESGDAAVFKVREEIAKEIAALKNVAAADIVGLHATLQSLQDASEKLTLLLPYAGKTLTPSTEIHSHADSSEPAHKLLDSAIESLHGVVTIRHTDQPIKETLTPEEAQFIREQLRAKLETVKIALVQQNEALYHAGLQDAKKWTELNFTPNPETRKFIAELDRFLAINIRSHFPDISTSLKLLRDITKLRIETDKALQSTPIEKPKAPEPKPLTEAPTAVTPPPAPAAPVQSEPTKK